jgi:hypothetical protein
MCAFVKLANLQIVNVGDASVTKTLRDEVATRERFGHSMMTTSSFFLQIIPYMLVSSNY